MEPQKVFNEDIFTTRMWVAELDFSQAYYQVMIESVYRIKKEQTIARGRSNRNGWNSDPILFENKDFSELRKKCITVFNHALVQMGGEKIRYRFQAWANILDQGGFNTMHVHPGSLLSGVFYLKVPDNSAPIMFRDPRPGVLLGSFRNGEVNSYVEKKLSPKRGMLVVFPSWLDHKVEIHEPEESRISIAINTDPAN
jgi:uncharacterized protein (TIGR02466 family)